MKIGMNQHNWFTGSACDFRDQRPEYACRTSVSSLSSSYGPFTIVDWLVDKFCSNQTITLLPSICPTSAWASSSSFSPFRACPNTSERARTCLAMSMQAKQRDAFIARASCFYFSLLYGSTARWFTTGLFNVKHAYLRDIIVAFILLSVHSSVHSFIVDFASSFFSCSLFSSSKNPHPLSITHRAPAASSVGWPLSLSSMLTVFLFVMSAAIFGRRSW